MGLTLTGHRWRSGQCWEAPSVISFTPWTVLPAECGLLSQEDNLEIQRGYRLTQDAGLRGWRNRLSDEDFVSWYGCLILQSRILGRQRAWALESSRYGVLPEHPLLPPGLSPALTRSLPPEARADSGRGKWRGHHLSKDGGEKCTL